MTNYLKHKIHCKNSLYIKHLKYGKRNCDYIELQRSIEEVSEDISKSKEQFFFYQNIDYNVQTNKLQSTKINQNNMIKMLQMINITLQPTQ